MSVWSPVRAKSIIALGAGASGGQGPPFLDLVRGSALLQALEAPHFWLRQNFDYGDTVSGEERPDGEVSEDERFDEEDGSDEDRKRPRIGRKLTDSLLTGLLESGARIKRGQDRVTGAAQGTKEELLRMVGTEVRGFLDKIDVVDMMQKVVSGLVIDVNATIRISHDDGEGKLKSEISRSEVKLGGDGDRKSQSAVEPGED